MLLIFDTSASISPSPSLATLSPSLLPFPLLSPLPLPLPPLATFSVLLEYLFLHSFVTQVAPGLIPRICQVR